MATVMATVMATAMAMASPETPAMIAVARAPH